MGVRSLSVSTVCTVLSFICFKWGTQSSLETLNFAGLIGDNFLHSEIARDALELLLGSYTTVAVVANFALNAFILLILCLKTIFFIELYSSETRKLAERLVNYVIYKGLFLPLVVPPTVFQAGLWSIWLIVLCSLKMLQALGRDRLERLNASPSITPWTYFRVYAVLLFVLCVDLFWLKVCLDIYRTLSSSMFLLLFFEPLSIAFETLQAIMVHGFQLVDIWINHSAWNSETCHISKFFDVSASGSLWEIKGTLVRNLGVFLDIMTLLMALGHYMHIWWLHGMAFHLVDAVLCLNIRALLSALVKRIKGFIKLRTALGTLHGALPEATSEEIKAFDDECAICREPMAKAKKLYCNHLFHLACLRSWLDQGLSESPSCPTCRKPLFVGRPRGELNSPSVDVSNDEQLAQQISLGFEVRNSSGHIPPGVLPNQFTRGVGLESSWLHNWPSQGLDAAGPSTAIRSVGLGRVQMVMRQLASVGENYAQTALEDAAWSLWPVNNPSQAGSSNPPATAVRYPVGTGGVHIRTGSRVGNDNLANILAMAETVREVLPHIPEELIFQDLQRTNSVPITVNNLLQM